MTETNSLYGHRFFERLLKDGHSELVAVVTRAPGILCDYYVDDPVRYDVAQTARDAGTRVLQPKDVNSSESVEEIRSLEPDYVIVANFQQRVGKEILATAEVINFHPSPLPRYAGLAPFYWMSVNGETQGGVSALRMTAGLDDGPLIAQHLLSLSGNEDADEIRRSHFEASWRLLDLVLPTLHERSYRSWPQDLSLRTYYGAPGD